MFFAFVRFYFLQMEIQLLKIFGIVVKETQKHIQTMFCMAAIVCHILLSFQYERLHNTRPLEPVIKFLNL